MTTSARHAVNGRTQPVTWTPSETSPTPAMRIEPWHPADPAVAYRLAAHANDEAGGAQERARRAEIRADLAIAVAAVAVGVLLIAAAAAGLVWLL